MPRPPETMIFAAASSGRADLVSSRPISFDWPRSGPAASASTAALPPVVGDGVEAGGAHRDDLGRVGRLHRRQRVAGIDRTHEGVGIDHGNDFRDLCHVEQRRHARQGVLAVAGGRRKDVAVARRIGDDQRGEVLRRLVAVVGGVGDAHLGDAGDFRRLLGHRAAVRCRRRGCESRRRFLPQRQRY